MDHDQMVRGLGISMVRGGALWGVEMALYLSCEKAPSAWSPTIGALMSVRKRSVAKAPGDIVSMVAAPTYEVV
jgi:hypothetical protein